MISFAGNNTFGTLSSAPDGGIVNHIYAYINSILEGFNGDKDENENKITNRLCKTLNSRKAPESSYFFHHQNIENDKENTSTDFAAFGTYAYAQENNIEDDSPSLIKFEAKRLSSKLPQTRDREYVVGEYLLGKQIKNSGGIERFKNGRHGKDVSNACIIGYVQTDTFSHWLGKINNFISEQITSAQDSALLWDAKDILKPCETNSKLASYSSVSKRSTGNDIYFKHLWVNFA